MSREEIMGLHNAVVGGTEPFVTSLRDRGYRIRREMESDEDWAEIEGTEHWVAEKEVWSGSDTVRIVVHESGEQLVVETLNTGGDAYDFYRTFKPPFDIVGPFLEGLEKVISENDYDWVHAAKAWARQFLADQ